MMMEMQYLRIGYNILPIKLLQKEGSIASMSMDYLELRSKDSKVEDKVKDVYNFLLVNPKSGDLSGKQLVESDIENLTFKHDRILSHFFAASLYNQFDRTAALMKANHMAGQNKNVRVIICGGDGTIEWVLEQCVKSKVDFERIVFGVLPIGTGNDFAESVGCKGLKFTGKMSQLKNLAIAFSECEVSTYDIWESVVECQNDGKITQIKNGNEVALSQKKLIRNFTNYFGLGTDARICYIAQKLKAQGVLMKKIAYGFAGFLSFFVQWGSLADKIVIKQKKYYSIDKDMFKTLNDMEATIEHTNLDEDEYEIVKLGKYDQCMAFINSTSSMELKHVWGTPYEIRANPQSQRGEYLEQKTNDENIEVVSYHNEVSILMERMMHMAKKVTQGKGPFKISFKKPNVKQSNYIHINGQPYKIQGLTSITIQPSSSFPNSKINVLTRLS